MLLSVASFVIIVSGLRAASELLIPIMLGLFLAILSLPILNWLDRHGVPRPLAIVLTIAFDLLILLSLLLLASGVIPEFQSKRLEYAKALQERAAYFSTTIDAHIEKLNVYMDKFRSLEEGEAAEPVVSFTFKSIFDEYWDPKLIVEWIGQTALWGKITSLASKSFFVLIIMIFVLSESGRYAQKIKLVVRERGPDLRGFQNSAQEIQKYLGIKTAVSAVTGILAWVACTVLEVDFPVLWGLVAFVFNYIPAIGSIVAAIPPIILALIGPGSSDTEWTIWPAVGVLACYLAINISIGNFIEPMLLGERFGISTTVVIVSVLFWGFVWGPVGMFLAVPLTMLVKVMLDNSTDLRWISVLLGKSVEMGPRRRTGPQKPLVKRRADATEPIAPAGPAGGSESGQPEPSES